MERVPDVSRNEIIRCGFESRLEGRRDWARRSRRLRHSTRKGRADRPRISRRRLVGVGGLAIRDSSDGFAPTAFLSSAIKLAARKLVGATPAGFAPRQPHAPIFAVERLASAPPGSDGGARFPGWTSRLLAWSD